MMHAQEKVDITQIQGPQLNCHWLLKILYYHGGTQTRTYVTISQHGPLSLDAKLEGPSTKILNFCIPTVRPLNDIQGPVDFSWSRLVVRV